jgi:hypothetical protein
MVDENINANNQNQRYSEILDELDTLSRLLDDLSIQMRSDQKVLRETFTITAQAA